MSRRMSRMRLGGRGHKKRVKTVRRKRRSLRRNTMKCCACPKVCRCRNMRNGTKRRRRRRSKSRKQKGG